MKKQSTEKRRMLNAGEWKRLLAEQKRSGQSVPAYCSALGVSCSSYYRWQKLLREGADSLFSPIEIVETKAAVGGVEVELPGGVVVRFRELPPVSYLRSLSVSFSGGGQ